MKTITKLVLATFAVSSIISASVLADDVRTVVRYNNHGESTIIYRADAPSVAVYAQGQSVGSAASAADSGALHLCVKDNNHGVATFRYRAE